MWVSICGNGGVFIGYCYALNVPKVCVCVLMRRMHCEVLVDTETVNIHGNEYVLSEEKE